MWIDKQEIKICKKEPNVEILWSDGSRRTFIWKWILQESKVMFPSP